jgi:hypothetical protein
MSSIVATLNSARFADCTPYTAWARLLDEGTYLASVRPFAFTDAIPLSIAEADEYISLFPIVWQ